MDSSKITSRYIFIFIVLLGFIFKLSLMPITLHGDWLWIHAWPVKWSFFGIFDGYEYMLKTYPEYFQQYGTFYYGPMTYLFISFFQFIFKFFIPNMGKWFYSFEAAGMSVVNTVNVLSDFYTSDIFKYLFFMKLPYLLIDSFILVILLNFCKKYKLFIAFLWAFNPVIIYGTYMFGQFDIIIGFLVLLSLFFVYKEKRYLAISCLGLGFSFKTVPVVLILPAAILLAENKKDFVKLILAAFISAFLPFAVFMLSSSSVLGVLLPGVLKGKLVGGEQAFEIAKLLKLSLLGAGYFGILFVCFKMRKIKIALFEKLLTVYVVVFLLMYSLLSCAVHYFLWCLPCLFLLACLDKTKVKYIWILSFCILLYKVKRASMCMGLFAPINPEYFNSFPGLDGFLTTDFMKWKNFVKIFRLVFIGTSGYIIYALIKETIINKKGLSCDKERVD